MKIVHAEPTKTAKFEPKVNRLSLVGGLFNAMYSLGVDLQCYPHALFMRADKVCYDVYQAILPVVTDNSPFHSWYEGWAVFDSFGEPLNYRFIEAQAYVPLSIVDQGDDDHPFLVDSSLLCKLAHPWAVANNDLVCSGREILYTIQLNNEIISDKMLDVLEQATANYLRRRNEYM